MKTIRAIAAVALGLAATVAMAADGDAAAGQKKTALCEGCHGIPSYRTRSEEHTSELQSH